MAIDVDSAPSAVSETASELERAHHDVEGARSADDSAHQAIDSGETVAESSWWRGNGPIAVVAAVIVVLGGLVGWLGYGSYQQQRAEQQSQLFLQVGRQGAINLTTIDVATADNDVQRILDSATGTFYDDFAQRSQPFVDVVKQARSRSVGTVTAAGIESATADSAEVLVSVTVRTSIADGPEGDPRSWRMRIAVQKQGDQVKVSDVQFVP